MTPFGRAVDEALRSLVPGEVVSYGELAEMAGYPGRARAVGAHLARSGGAGAWWRVVNAAGRLAPGKEREQARLLAGERVGLSADGSRVVAFRARRAVQPRAAAQKRLATSMVAGLCCAHAGGRP